MWRGEATEKLDVSLKLSLGGWWDGQLVGKTVWHKGDEFSFGFSEFEVHVRHPGGQMLEDQLCLQS